MCDECLAPQNIPSAFVLTLGNKVVFFSFFVFCFVFSTVAYIFIFIYFLNDEPLACCPYIIQVANWQLLTLYTISRLILDTHADLSTVRISVNFYHISNMWSPGLWTKTVDLNGPNSPSISSDYSGRIKDSHLLHLNIGGGDSSVVRAPDSWLKGRGFESLLERRENFLLQSRLSVLTLISVSVPPPCYHSST